MSWPRRFAAVGIALSASFYAAASAYIVSVSLTPRTVCPPGEGPPTDLPAETVSFRSPIDKTPLAGWLIPTAGDRAVILIHGIDRDGWAGSQPEVARAYVDARFDVFVFDLRGHGQSGGTRISLGNLERKDVRAAVDVLLARGVAPGRIGIHGTSYGAAMGLLAAAEIPEIGAVVSDSAYANVSLLIGSHVERRTGVPGAVAATILRPGILGMARILYGLDLDVLAPERAVAAIGSTPLLLVHGGSDTVIPPQHAALLKAQAGGESSELWILDGLSHAEGVSLRPCHLEPSPHRAAFLERVVSFFDTAL